MRPSEAAAAAVGGAEHTVVVKTTRITIETDSLLVVHRGKTVVTWCPVCRADVEAMTLEGETPGDGISTAFLPDWLATGKLHFWRRAEGPAQICLPSLLQCFESEDVRRLRSPMPTHPKTGDKK
jgi:hypothetical protein